jgi:hypothetical protein
MSELAVAHAARIKLPESYEAAKKAIAHCAELDECARWVDKAAAMAACARIAEDETMLKDAMRIQAHAVRHIGELIKLVPAAPGPQKRTKAGTVPSSPRRQATSAAGISERQAKTAVRVANVPQETFDEQVEAANPPTVTALALAKQGTQPRPQPSNVELVDDDAMVARGKKIIAAVVEHLRMIPTTRERVDFRRRLLADLTDEMLRLGGNESA